MTLKDEDTINASYFKVNFRNFVFASNAMATTVDGMQTSKNQIPVISKDLITVND